MKRYQQNYFFKILVFKDTNSCHVIFYYLCKYNFIYLFFRLVHDKIKQNKLIIIVLTTLYIYIYKTILSINILFQKLTIYQKKVWGLGIDQGNPGNS